MQYREELAADVLAVGCYAALLLPISRLSRLRLLLVGGARLGVGVYRAGLPGVWVGIALGAVVVRACVVRIATHVALDIRSVFRDVRLHIGLRPCRHRKCHRKKNDGFFQDFPFDTPTGRVGRFNAVGAPQSEPHQ